MVSNDVLLAVLAPNDQLTPNGQFAPNSQLAPNDQQRVGAKSNLEQTKFNASELRVVRRREVAE